MNITSQRFLAQQTSNFYACHSESFSATRQHAWNGWQTCAEHILSDVDASEKDQKLTHFSVCDIACGNLRLVKFLENLLETKDTNEASDNQCETGSVCKHGSNALLPYTTHIDYTGVDYCMDLCELASTKSDSCVSISTQQCNLVEALLLNKPLLDTTKNPYFDLVSCMGFFHHVPGFSTRKQLLEQLVELTRPGGYIACSLWAFLRDERIASQAKRVTATKLEDERFASAVELEDNDYLLGWKGDTSCVRYCHHTSEEELKELIDSVSSKTKLIACFDADGKTGNLNRYLVLKKLA